MLSTFIPFFSLTFLLVVIFILVILYVRVPPKASIPLEAIRIQSGILKLNDYHYRVLSSLSDCLSLDVDAVEKLNSDLLELKKIEKEIEENQYTIAYFHLVNKIMILLMHNDFKLNEEEFIHAISLFQLMANFIPLINKPNV